MAHLREMALSSYVNIGETTGAGVKKKERAESAWVHWSRA